MVRLSQNLSIDRERGAFAEFSVLWQIIKFQGDHK